jgi:hypothetical protein
MNFSVADYRPYDAGKIRRGAARKARYLEARTGCWFCGLGHGSSSNEHVLGRWVEKHFDTETLRFQPQRVSMASRGEARGPMPSSSMSVGGVCARCNNGWMSRLEQAAERILSGPATSVAAEDARVLAQWAEKTAVVLNLASPFPLAWNRDDRRSVILGPSSRSRVSLFRVEDSDVNTLQGEEVTGTVPSKWPTGTQLSVFQLVHVARVRLGRIVVVTLHVPWQMEPLRRYEMPGKEIWNGVTPCDYESQTLPSLATWLRSSVHLDGGNSVFWRTPSLHDVYEPGCSDWRSERAGEEPTARLAVWPRARPP